MNPLGLSFGPTSEADVEEDKDEDIVDGKKKKIAKSLGLHDSQHKRLKGLQNPKSLFDNAGNLIES